MPFHRRRSPGIHDRVRGMNPWPVAWFAHEGKRIKVQESRLAEKPENAAPGTVLALKPLTIAAENGAVSSADRYA